MGLEDRSWFQEDHDRRAKAYNNDFSLNSKPTQRYDTGINTNAIGVFEGNAISTKRKGIDKFHVKASCGRCNNVSVVTINQRPYGRYRYICPKCNANVEVEVKSHSIGTWILFFISIIILYFMIFS